MKKKIFVTESIVPELGVYTQFIEKMFNSHVLTNNGVNCRALETAIKNFLNVEFVTACSNGTVGIEIALHAAELAGKKIITTPFSYVATISAPLWIGCQVLLADIDEDTLCIDPHKIGELLDADVAGIIPVNVYGHPCNDAAIETLASSCGRPVKVVYDAAQAFGSSIGGKSLLAFGDFAICSLHATKVFHSFEGGFVVSHHKADY